MMAVRATAARPKVAAEKTSEVGISEMAAGFRAAACPDCRYQRRLTPHYRSDDSVDSVSNVGNVAGYELFGEERATCRGGDWPGDLPLCATNVAK